MSMKNYLLLCMSIFALSPLYAAVPAAASDMGAVGHYTTRFIPFAGEPQNISHPINRSLLTWLVSSKGDDTSRLTQVLSDKSYKESINCADPEGELPLIIALQKHANKAVRVLLNNKAEPNTRDDYGDTPLVAAAGAGNIEGAKLLIAHKANCTLDRESGISPLMKAVMSFNPKMVQFIINHIPKFDLACELRKTADGVTVLELAENCRTNKEAIVLLGLVFAQAVKNMEEIILMLNAAQEEVNRSSIRPGAAGSPVSVWSRPWDIAAPEQKKAAESEPKDQPKKEAAKNESPKKPVFAWGKPSGRILPPEPKKAFEPQPAPKGQAKKEVVAKLESPKSPATTGATTKKTKNKKLIRSKSANALNVLEQENAPALLVVPDCAPAGSSSVVVVEVPASVEADDDLLIDDTDQDGEAKRQADAQAVLESEARRALPTAKKPAKKAPKKEKATDAASKKTYAAAQVPMGQRSLEERLENARLALRARTSAIRRLEGVKCEGMSDEDIAKHRNIKSAVCKEKRKLEKRLEALQHEIQAQLNG